MKINVPVECYDHILRLEKQVFLSENANEIIVDSITKNGMCKFLFSKS